jgi:hypothetical protein
MILKENKLLHAFFPQTSIIHFKEKKNLHYKTIPLKEPNLQQQNPHQSTSNRK